MKQCDLCDNPVTNIIFNIYYGDKKEKGLYFIFRKPFSANFCENCLEKEANKFKKKSLICSLSFLGLAIVITIICLLNSIITIQQIIGVSILDLLILLMSAFFLITGIFSSRTDRIDMVGIQKTKDLLKKRLNLNTKTNEIYLKYHFLTEKMYNYMYSKNQISFFD